jgi:TRAP-type C4-dicarboxylate transport system substrate-binding protein
MKKTSWGVALVIVLLALGLASLLVSCGGQGGTAGTASTERPAKTFELKFSYHTPPQASIVGYYFNPWVEAIDKATNGQVKITQYAGGSLAKQADQYEAVTSGLCDMALVCPSAMPGRFPHFEFDGLPFLFPSAGVGSAVYWDMVQKYGANDDFKDVVVLGVVALAGAQYVGNKPIEKLEDFQGLRIRNDGAEEAKVVEALGATPVEIETSELATSIERGMADGCFLTWSGVFSFGVGDYTKYRTKCDIFYRIWPICINKSVWDSMGSEIQAEILSVSGLASSVNYSEVNEGTAAPMQQGLETAGAAKGNPPIVVLTDEQKATWRTKLTPLWDEWAAGVQNGPAILADIKAAVAKYATQYATTSTTGGSTESTGPTGTTVAASENGIFFEDLGNKSVHISIVPGPGMKFDVSTEGGFASKIEAFDAAGKSLGLVELLDAAKGVLDYSSIAGIAKLVVTDVPHGGVEYEYLVP